MKSAKWTALLFSAAATVLAMPAAHAGWVTPTYPTGTVLTNCNPKPFTVPAPSACLLTGNTLLAAVGTGYIQRSASSASIVINGVTVGTLYDRVLCPGSGTTCSSNTYVLAVRVRLNSNAWNGHSSESFEVNDTTRAVLSTLTADAAYWMGPDTGGSTTSANPDLALANQKWLEYVGRTQYGLNEAMSGTRSDGYMGFRQDYNANDPDGVSSQWSAWLLVRQVCDAGVPTTRPNFTIKLWEGGEEAQDHYTQWMAGYKCS